MGNNPFPGQEPLRCKFVKFGPGVAFIIEMPLDGAVLLLEWLFDAVSNDRTRITQRIVLSGANAATYVNQVQTSLGSNLCDGMARIAAPMAKAACSTRGTDR